MVTHLEKNVTQHGGLDATLLASIAGLPETNVLGTVGRLF
jgi:hypothetical protein